MKIPFFFKAVVVAVVGFGLGFYFYNRATEDNATDVPHAGVMVGFGNKSGSEIASKETTVAGIGFKTGSEAVTKQEMAFTNVTTVALDSVNADVVIKQSGTEQGRINYDASGIGSRAISITKSNGKLMLRITGKKDKQISSVVISLPNQVNQVAINSVQGDVTAKGLNLTEIAIRTVSGDIHLDDVHAKKLASMSITTVSGDTYVKFDGVPDLPVHTRTISGDVTLDSEISNAMKSQAKSDTKGQISFNSVSGDINVLH